MDIFGYIVAVLLGLVFGSYAGALVWRLRARQLVQDKKDGETVAAKELKRLEPLTKSTMTNDRSRCLACHHELAWYDLIPLFSWLSTKGRCRYCKKPIGRFEPLMEIATAAVFVLAYHVLVIGDVITAPYLIVLWTAVIVMMVVLFVYDAKWFILPDRVVFPLIALSAIIGLVQLLTVPDKATYALSALGAVIILSGIYFILWVVSKGQWIGFGDVKLGIALGLLLGNWQLAFLALFLANLLGTLIVIPGLVTKRMSRKTQVPFGPLLIAGFAIALLFGQNAINWYAQLTFPGL